MTARARLVLVLPLCLVVVAIGCTGTSKSNSAIVTGKITYNKTALGGGTITFHTADKTGIYPVAISPDGTYMGTDLPPGDMTVSIETTSVKAAKSAQDYGGAAPGGGKGTSPAPKGYNQVSGKYVEIPAKYADPKTSGQKITLTSGKQTKNWDLTD